MPAVVELSELRVLDGPNIYFPRPAVKVSLLVPGWLRASRERLERISSDIGLPRSAASPGDRGSEGRRRFTAGVGAAVARRLAAEASTRLAVRGRAGSAAEEIVVAFPWRRRGTSEALAREVASVMSDLLRTRRPLARLAVAAAERIRAADPGPAPSLPEPSIPVVAVTGTNGKTTTVRLVAHLVRAAGRSVAYSTTDGVYRDDTLVEAGDYSGFAGAGMALAQDGVGAAVLETARGGILLRGIGTAANDVAVVTNVSSDHLGLHGIYTLDQLAEVKAAITRITRPDGWAVLNADDPRVLAMRARATGRPFLFSLDPHHPAVREVLPAGGRALTVIDRSIVLLAGRRAPHALVGLDDVPATLAGISSSYISNALAATAAALGIGIGEDAVVRGLRTFVLDPATNPGRANVFTLGERVVVIDYAHNEAGMIGLTEILGGLRGPGSAIWLAFCTAGDRGNEILHALGYRAARGADHVMIAELPRYLRGRDPRDLVERLRAGAVDGGATDVPDAPDEVAALERMLERSGPRDIVCVTALAQRPEIFRLLEERGATLADPATVRRLVRRARRER